MVFFQRILGKKILHFKIKDAGSFKPHPFFKNAKFTLKNKVLSLIIHFHIDRNRLYS
jgi:hypothetical protein